MLVPSQTIQSTAKLSLLHAVIKIDALGQFFRNQNWISDLLYFHTHYNLTKINSNLKIFVHCIDSDIIFHFNTPWRGREGRGRRRERERAGDT